MSMTRWLIIVGVLTLSLLLIKAPFGDSPLWIVAFALVSFLTFELARGTSNWVSAISGALVAAAVYVLYLGLMPPDTAGRQAGLALLVAAVAAPFVIRVVRDRRRHQHQL
jgi:hypothetical protein